MSWRNARRRSSGRGRRSIVTPIDPGCDPGSIVKARIVTPRHDAAAAEPSDNGQAAADVPGIVGIYPPERGPIEDVARLSSNLHPPHDSVRITVDNHVH